jgi:hypothetical protein
VAPDAARFCRKRPEKRDHAIALGLTHFVDDRVDVLQALRGVVPRLYLFGAQTGPLPEFAAHVPDWIAASEALLADVEVDVRRTSSAVAGAPAAASAATSASSVTHPAPSSASPCSAGRCRSMRLISFDMCTRRDVTAQA